MRREEEERERTKRKRKEERDKSKVCREEQRRKKNSNKKGQRKEERETSRGKRGDRGGRECIFWPIVGIFSPFYLAVRLVWPKIRIDFFLPFTWASEKIGPWLAVHYFFSLILGSSAMSAHSLRSNFVFPFTWASHLLEKLEVIILLPCPWAFHFKPATFTKSYGYA